MPVYTAAAEVPHAFAMDGSCSGERGMGLHKRGCLVEDLDKEAVEFMRRLNRSRGPLNTVSLGKVVEV